MFNFFQTDKRMFCRENTWKYLLTVHELLTNPEQDNDQARLIYSDVLLVFSDQKIFYSQLLLKVFHGSLWELVKPLISDNSDNTPTLVFTETALQDVHLCDITLPPEECDKIDPTSCSVNLSSCDDAILPNVESVAVENFCEISKPVPTEQQIEVVSTKCLFQCNDCKKFFDSKKKLSKHKLVHVAKSFFCAFCPSGFKRKQDLISHYNKFHSENKQEFKCEICNSSFKSSFNLKRHSKIHVNDKSDHVSCPNCKKIFSHKHNMKHHLTKCSKI